jgi:hypothetical protein
MNYNLLLEQAKEGKIAGSDVDAVARMIESSDPNTDRYTLLHILGRSNALRHRVLVERHLDDDDSMLVRLSLQILCTYWDETDRYVEYVRAYASRNPRDPDNDARLAALAIAGEYLRAHEDRILPLTLVRTFEDPNEDRIVREAAYRAMARARGLDWHELPPSSRHFDLEANIRPEVVEEMRRRAHAGEGV